MLKNKDKSDENYYNAIDNNKFNKISEIGSNKFFRNHVYKCRGAAITNDPPPYDDEVDVPRHTQR